jgi:hypothetical protein
LGGFTSLGGGGTTAALMGGNGNGGGFAQMHCRPPVPNLPTWTQQLVRSFIYGSQFSAAFLVYVPSHPSILVFWGERTCH